MLRFFLILWGLTLHVVLDNLSARRSRSPPPGMREAAVVVEAGAGNEQLLARPSRRAAEPSLTSASVRVWLRDRLPDGHRPNFVRLRDHLPRTSSGKVDRRALAS